MVAPVARGVPAVAGGEPAETGAPQRCPKSRDASRASRLAKIEVTLTMSLSPAAHSHSVIVQIDKHIASSGVHWFKSPTRKSYN